MCWSADQPTGGCQVLSFLILPPHPYPSMLPFAPAPSLSGSLLVIISSQASVHSFRVRSSGLSSRRLSSVLLLSSCTVPHSYAQGTLGTPWERPDGEELGRKNSTGLGCEICLGHNRGRVVVKAAQAEPIAKDPGVQRKQGHQSCGGS